MIERSGELPDDVDQLKALALEALARADRFEAEAHVKKTDAQALRSQALSLTSQVEDLTQTNAVAKAEIARLTLILKTLRRGRFGKNSEKLGADEAEQQSFVFEEMDTGLGEIDARPAAKSLTKTSSESAVAQGASRQASVSLASGARRRGREARDSAGVRRQRAGQDRRGRELPARRRAGPLPPRREIPRSTPSKSDARSRKRRPPSTSSRPACRPRRCWRRSPPPNTPMACRCTARRPSTPATASNSAAR